MPVVDGGTVKVIQSAAVVADHVQSLTCALTWTTPLPPAGPGLAVVGVRK